MAKKAVQVIAVTSILTVMAIAAFGMKVYHNVWDQSEKHATQAEQVKVVVEDVKVLKPVVADLKMKVNSLEIKQEAILKGVTDIQATQKIMLERIP